MVEAAINLFDDATTLLERLTRREVTALALLNAAIARAERLDPQLNAIVARDVNRATDDARRIDVLRAQGAPVGRLAGLPMTVKDTLDVEGMPGSAGDPRLLNRKCSDAEVVRRVRTEGAIIWGKTNTPLNAGDLQTYNALYGTTNNPWDVSRTPGGSSGGSAAALAAGLTPLEIGADIGGSLRIPASFCGVFAHKPTYGLVPQHGLVPPAHREADIDMAVVGPMARSARDLRLLLSIVAGVPLASPILSLNGLRVALWTSAPPFVLSNRVTQCIAAFSQRLKAAGVSIEEVPSPVDTHRLMTAYAIRLFSLTGAALPPAAMAAYELLRWPAKAMRLLGADPLSAAQGILALTARHRDWLAADETRAQLTHTIEEFLTNYDVLISPVTMTAALPHDHGLINLRKIDLGNGRRVPYLKQLEWVALPTLCGLPATAIPIGPGADGLPIGVQLIGRRNADAQLLAIAEAIEQRLGGFQPPPLQ